MTLQILNSFLDKKQGLNYDNNEINSSNQNETKEQVINKSNINLMNRLPRIQVDELPSNFISYPKGSKIFYTPMTLKELDLLNSGSINVEDAMLYLLESIDCEGFDKNDLAYFDVVYIGIKRKLTAMGDCMGMLVKQCPNCGEYIEYKFNYIDLDFQDCQLDKLPIIVDFDCCKGVEFSFLTIKDWLDLDSDSKALSIYAKYIKNMPYEDALSLVENLTGNDIKKLYEVQDKLAYGISPFKTKCKNTIEDIELNDKGEPSKILKECGQEVEMEVTSPYEVIFCED